MSLLERIFTRGGADTVSLSREQILAARPTPNPDVTMSRTSSESVVLTYPVEASGITKFLQKFSSSRGQLARRFELDNAGAEVWDLCDGRHAVDDIISFMRDKYAISRDEAEKSSVLYIRMLAERGLLVLDLSDGPDGGE
ncbi:MAG: PqqD family protein [Planctomycetes bacterium]|nr:PqqD family protein [Planctomycetota bacterium]